MAAAARAKAQRVAVMRAARRVAERRPEVHWRRGAGRGRVVILFRRDNVASAALANVKMGFWGRRSETAARQEAAALMREKSDLQLGWYREVQQFLAERDGD